MEAPLGPAPARRFGAFLPPKLLKTKPTFELVAKYDFDCGLGIVGIAEGAFLIGRGGGTGEALTGRVVVATTDEQAGLVVQETR